MKKGLVKGLTCLGLAGVMIGAVVGMSGCDRHYEYDYSSDSKKTISTLHKNVYIVVKENDVSTLHKGDICTEHPSGSGSSDSAYALLRFNCGKEIWSTTFNFYPQTPPDPSKYNERIY